MTDRLADALDGAHVPRRLVVPVEPVDTAARLTYLDGSPRSGAALMAAGFERTFREREQNK